MRTAFEIVCMRTHFLVLFSNECVAILESNYFLIVSAAMAQETILSFGSPRLPLRKHDGHDSEFNGPCFRFDTDASILHSKVKLLKTPVMKRN